MKKLLGVIILSFAIILGGCASGGKDVKADQVLKAFEKAGLNMSDSVTMKTEDFDPAAPVAATEGIQFTTETGAGTVLIFKSSSDVDKMKKVYEELAKIAPGLSPKVVTHGNALLQIGGDMPEEEFNKFKDALKGIK